MKKGIFIAIVLCAFLTTGMTCAITKTENADGLISMSDNISLYCEGNWSLSQAELDSGQHIDNIWKIEFTDTGNYRYTEEEDVNDGGHFIVYWGSGTNGTVYGTFGGSYSMLDFEITEVDTVMTVVAYQDIYTVYSGTNGETEPPYQINVKIDLTTVSAND